MADQNKNGALILTRRTGEALIIGDDISVTVLGVKGNQVRLGITAPRSVGVYRKEIYIKIKNEKNDEQHNSAPAEE